MSDGAERLTAADFDQELLVLFDAYVHGDLDRRGFLERARKFALGGMSAAGLLAALSPDFALGQVVPPGDERLLAQTITVPSPDGHGTIRGYLCRPAASHGPLPGVLVCHENRGLNPHIEDVARRLALEGYLAFAPDALTSLGGYPGDEDRARALFAQLDSAKTRADFLAAARALASRPECNGWWGVVGFCWGGGMAHWLSTQSTGLGAAVAFYGNFPPAADAARVKAPLLLHFAEHDERISAAWPDYEAALKSAGVRYEAYRYAGTQHGFNNDTTPRFDAKAAELAWGRTLSFLAGQRRS